MGEALSLVCNKSNSHSEHSPKQTCGIGTFKGVRQIGPERYELVQSSIPCNTWGCPNCRPKKVKKYAKRALEGRIGLYEGQKGFRSRYDVKMFTLTCPGKDYRKRLEENAYTWEYEGDHDPDDAYRDMTQQFDKLIRAMKKAHGDFLYIRAVEPQRDGYPHFHVVMVGKCIRPKAIFQYVIDLWKVKYGQGHCWVSSPKSQDGKPKAFKSVKHAVFYCMKYLKKAPGKFHKFSRPITNCQKALAPVEKKPCMWFGYSFKKEIASGEFSGIEMTFKDQRELEDFLYRNDLLYEYQKYNNADWIKSDSEFMLERELGKKNFHEVMSFFDDIVKSYHHVQKKLF